ncbi:low-specificity L-threonine aldolase [bacterium]|nr:low-specificity L-threonine aldolase [bacterium]
MKKYSDFRSDTVTKPTVEMRKAMFEASVGDDVFEDDPTVNKLEKLAAKMLGKEAGLFIPSGTMGNQIAIRLHTNPGDEIIVGDSSHIIQHEVGGAARNGLLQTRTLRSKYGILDLKEIENTIREDDIHFPKTSLICIENPHNDDGGVVLSLEYMKDLYNLAKKNGLYIHLDGARIFNAAIFLGTDVKNIAKYADTIMFCLSKGLSSPIGSMIVGTKKDIKKARKIRKMLGGGMRQVGIIAAAGIISLKKMVERMKDDHKMAEQFAKFIKQFKEIKVDMKSVQTNMVYFWIKDNLKLITYLKKKGVLVIPHGDRIRVTFHKDVNDSNLKNLEVGVKEYLYGKKN